MQIKTFTPENYKECPVYFRNFYQHFEYLTIIENQIYTAHITIQPTAYDTIRYWLGLEKMKYSKDQLDKILGLLRKMVQTTIDEVLKGEL